MSTPAFVAQGLNTLSEIRYYTAFDPYFYTVDNRPLQDIESNLVKLGSQGSDSARRAVLFSQLGTSSAYASLFPLGGTYLSYMHGLPVSLNGTTLTIGAGAVYVRDAINSDISTQILKQAMLVTPAVLNLTAPASGLVKNVLVQAELRSLTESNMAVSRLPFMDATNPLLGCTLLNYELVVSVKEGADATLGNQITPAVDTGKVELFVLTYSSVVSESTLALHANGPATKGADSSRQYVSSNTLANDSTTSIQVPVSLKGLTLNPLKPIHVEVYYSSSAPGGAITLSVSYRSLTSGGLVNSNMVVAGSTSVLAPSTSDTLAIGTLSSSTIPVSAFAGWSSGTWSVKADAIQISVSRIGGDVGDTNTGVMTLHEVRVFQ